MCILVIFDALLATSSFVKDVSKLEIQWHFVICYRSKQIEFTMKEEEVEYDKVAGGREEAEPRLEEDAETAGSFKSERVLDETILFRGMTDSVEGFNSTGDMDESSDRQAYLDDFLNVLMEVQAAGARGNTC
ncbi:hypothetical protein Nepgr_026266 [Nepenthes gracilis]|uniref:Uncharacterized protein n=1 Tax=Nepenthes gracilis TaxID=150966 RepID=A0AAD3T6I8_NEPGR|nr:hypothetical protein Nepgr_026266 [Nepenthes gracilis]